MSPIWVPPIGKLGGPEPSLTALEGAPAVGPDRVLALIPVPVGLVAAGVNDLEVVEVAVGLVEITVTVVVVTVPSVVALQGRLDLGIGPAGAFCWSTQAAMASRTRYQVLAHTLTAQGKPLLRPYLASL